MKDILLIVDSLANEKGLEKDVVFKAIELAIAVTTAKGYHPEEVDMRVSIDRDTGDYDTFRVWTVVADDELEEAAKEMTLTGAKKDIDPELDVGDTVEEQVESIDFGRIAAQQAKQVIMRELRQAEREEIAKAYTEKVGKLVMGVVKRAIREQIILDMRDGVEAIIPKEEMIPKEIFRVGDQLRAVLVEVRSDHKSPMLLLSRARPEMLIELFKLEVPEISEEVIEIKASARDPGSRAKVAVKTNDGRIDPVGACVGMRGSRVQTVSNELNNERIDIILWDDDPAQLVVNAMAPAEIASIVVDEEAHSMDIAVREDQLAQAIGRSGQNVQLASKLTGWILNVMNEADAEEKAKDKSSDLVKVFVEGIDVDEDLANVLVQEGFTSLEEIAYTPVEDMLSIEGMNKEIIDELRDRARNVLLTRALVDESQVGTVEPEKDLLELEGMNRHLAYVLASNGIVTREDLAEQSVDELKDIEGLSEAQAADLIMKARAHWFE